MIVGALADGGVKPMPIQPPAPIATMILGTTIFFSAMIIFFNLVSDILVLILNPRARDS